MEFRGDLINHETFDKVRQMTPRTINEKIDRRMLQRVEEISAEGPEAIKARLQELEKEWDLDKVLMLNFAVLVFAQLVAARKDRRWLWGPLIQTPFMAMHSIMGWCPPSLWFRPMGFRTDKEIQSEREELLAILSRMSTTNPGPH